MSISLIFKDSLNSIFTLAFFFSIEKREAFKTLKGGVLKLILMGVIDSTSAFKGIFNNFIV